MEDDIAEAADLLRVDHNFDVDVDGRTFCLRTPANGEPGFAVLRLLGLAEAASPVGAAAHGPKGVAVGLWRSPDLYLSRWTSGKRWVVAYRLPSGAKPNDYVKTEGRIPTRLEAGSWYGDVPDELNDAFLDVGMLLDEPPFPVPKAPPPPPPAAPKRPPAAPRRASAPRTPRPAAKPKPQPPVARVCPSCGMQKAAPQFTAGSELCVDCR